MLKNPCFLRAFSGASLVAFIGTLGEYLWALWVTQPNMIHGIVFGTALCLAIGPVLVWTRRRFANVIQAILACALIGAFVAASFYWFASFMGAPAMFLCWMLLWVGFALIEQQWRHLKAALFRGFIASLFSGIGFFPVYYLWTNPAIGNLYLFWPAWFLALFPGFLTLFWQREDQPQR